MAGLKSKKNGFSFCPKPSMILGADKQNGQLVFLMKWKGTNHNFDIVDIVPAKLANVLWPQVVIKFYEERMFWYD